MIPDNVIDSFGDNSFVVHPSLLPFHRGSSPISAALLANDNKTGVSIVGISKGKFDAGKIFL
jgi:methionyl-tRNA formyltransferase